MSDIVQISSKGQVTLPEPIRRKLGLAKGDVLAVEEKDGAIVLRPASVLPIQMYTDEEIAAWSKADELTDSERERFRAALATLAAAEK